MCATAAAAVLANVIHIYGIVTFDDRTVCYQWCGGRPSAVSALVQYSSWCLWLTTGFFLAVMLRMSRLYTTLYHVALPFAPAISINYTLYLFGSRLGTVTVDSNACVTLSDSGTPRGRSTVATAAWIFADRYLNFSMHYGCAILLLAVYFGCPHIGLDYPRNIHGWPLNIVFFMVLSLAVAFVHLNMSPVYCLARFAEIIRGTSPETPAWLLSLLTSVWTTVSIVFLTCCALHSLFVWHTNFRTKRGTTLHTIGSKSSALV